MSSAYQRTSLPEFGNYWTPSERVSHGWATQLTGWWSPSGVVLKPSNLPSGSSTSWQVTNLHQHVCDTLSNNFVLLLLFRHRFWYARMPERQTYLEFEEKKTGYCLYIRGMKYGGYRKTLIEQAVSVIPSKNVWSCQCGTKLSLANEHNASNCMQMTGLSDPCFILI